MRYLTNAHPIAEALDLARDDHRQAWAAYEAEREVVALLEGDEYSPRPVVELRFCDGRIYGELWRDNSASRIKDIREVIPIRPQAPPIRR